jgi:hypothetical protein
MDFKTASAAFVVAPTAVIEPSALGLADGVPLGEDRVGYGIHDPALPAFIGEWPAVGRTWCRVDPVGDRQLVQLFFSYNEFIELWSEDEDVPLEQDPLKPLADAFAAAAEGLDAEIGWVDGRAHHGHEDWENRLGSVTLNTGWARRYVDEGRDAILDEDFQLTWMRQDVTAGWGPDFTRAFETTDAGWLLWKGDESSRWF